MSYIRQNNKFYFQVIDLMVVLTMPDLRAAGKSPYGSSTSATRAALTHKVIHRNCAELFAGDKHYEAWQKRRCRIFAHGHKSIINQGLELPCLALHTILSTKNVQNLCALPILSINARWFVPACFLRNVRIVLQNKDIKTGPRACAQSYPQNMGKTG